MTAGMAFEALNHAGAENSNLLVILNDNAMGIDPSVGALKNYLEKSNIEINKENNIQLINDKLSWSNTGRIWSY